MFMKSDSIKHWTTDSEGQTNPRRLTQAAEWSNINHQWHFLFVTPSCVKWRSECKNWKSLETLSWMNNELITTAGLPLTKSPHQLLPVFIFSKVRPTLRNTSAHRPNRKTNTRYDFEHQVLFTAALTVHPKFHQVHVQSASGPPRQQS